MQSQGHKSTTHPVCIVLAWQCYINQSSIANYCWQFRCLGRNVLDNWLHTRSLQTEGRSLELDYQRSSNRWNLSSKKRSRSDGRKCHHRRCFISFNRRRRHPLHKAFRWSVQESKPTRNPARSISLRWSEQRRFQFWRSTSKLPIIQLWVNK